MRSWIKVCTLMLVLTSASAGLADNPSYTGTKWRIPDNRATLSSIRWRKVEHSGNHVNLEGGIGRHHTYETAWEYYSRQLGCQSKYVAGVTRDVFRNEDFTIREIPKSNAYRINGSLPVDPGDEARPKDRRTTMIGTLDRMHIRIALWTESENPDADERVYVKMFFRPVK